MRDAPVILGEMSLLQLAVVTLIVETLSSSESTILCVFVGAMGFGPLTKSRGGWWSSVVAHLVRPLAVLNSPQIWLSLASRRSRVLSTLLYAMWLYCSGLVPLGLITK